MSLWEDYEPCSFQLDGRERINFVAKTLGMDGGIRIARRVRPFRRGAKLDQTGEKEGGIPFEMLFWNEIEEPGVTDDGGLPLYPDRLDQIMEAFGTGETGTLNLPWKRGLRAKCETWSRREVADDGRNGAVLTGTFIEDNEDNLDREAVVRPSPRATLPRQVEATQFDAESSGAWMLTIADLTQLSSEVVGLISTPQEYIGQLKSAAKSLRAAVDNIRKALTTNFDGRDQFDDPDSAAMRIKLLEIEELAAQAEWEAQRRQRATTRYYPDSDTNIWTIATIVRQDPEELSALNADEFEDLSFIEGGSGVRIYVNG